jgi:hypothetical protein
MTPARWGPPPDRPWHVALWHGPDGLADIEVDEVLSATRTAQAGANRAAATR